MSAIKSLRAMSLRATSKIRLRNNAISYVSRFHITQDWSSTTKRSCTIIPRAIRRNVSGNGSRPNAPCNKAHAPSFQTCRPSTLSFADGRWGLGLRVPSAMGVLVRANDEENVWRRSAVCKRNISPCPMQPSVGTLCCRHSRAAAWYSRDNPHGIMRVIYPRTAQLPRQPDRTELASP